MIDRKRIEEEAQHFFEWPDPKDKNTVTLFSCIAFAHTVAAMSAAAARERCAAWVDARRDEFCAQHGCIDTATGALEFGRGAHAEAKSEYVGELEEIAAGLRALKA